MMTSSPSFAEYSTSAATLKKADAFVRLVCLSILKYDSHIGHALEDFAHQHVEYRDLPTRYLRALEARALTTRAAVAAGTTSDAGWSSVAPLKEFADGFLALARPATILGRIPGMRLAPFNTAIPVQTAPGAYAWSAEGKAKAVSRLSFATVSLKITKCSGILVETEELARLQDPASADLLRTEMVKGVAKFTDEAFLDPASAGIPNAVPASLTNGVAAVATSTLATLVADVDTKLIPMFYVSNPDAETAVLIMPPAVVPTLARSGGSSTQFSGRDGVYNGIPVIVSGAAGPRITMVDAASITLADAGIEVSDSRHATLEMSDAPSADPVASTVAISLWQNNLVGLRGERFVNWVKANATCVQWLGPITLPSA